MTDQGDINRMRRIGQRIESYGVEVRWMSGWEQRGSTWPRVPIGVIDHHDAASIMTGEWGVLGYIVSAGLAQFQVARCLDGKPRVAICAAGIQAHAGKGGWRFPDGAVVPTNSGNSYLYGVEKANNGLGESYNDAAIYAADATFHAILVECGVPLSRVVGHKEYGNTPPGGWAGRKSDPQYRMDWRRERVVNFTPQNGENDMNLQELVDFRYSNGRNFFDLLHDVHSTLLGQYAFDGRPALAKDDNTGHGLTVRREVSELRREVTALREALVGAVDAAANRVRDDVRADLAAGYGLKLEPKDSEGPADPR